MIKDSLMMIQTSGRLLKDILNIPNDTPIIDLYKPHPKFEKSTVEPETAPLDDEVKGTETEDRIHVEITDHNEEQNINLCKEEDVSVKIPNFVKKEEKVINQEVIEPEKPTSQLNQGITEKITVDKETILPEAAEESTNGLGMEEFLDILNFDF